MTKEKFTDLNVESIEAISINAKGDLRGCAFMSPYVWLEDGDRFDLMLRGVPPDPGNSDTGCIYYGTSEDGLHFDMDEKPALAPGEDPEAPDHGGCEDPTVVKCKKDYVVYYTGVEKTHTRGVLLYATGPSMRELTKRGVAHASTPSEGNVKEATIAQLADGRWRLFYEYAFQQASLIGLTFGDDIHGPWHAADQPFGPRPGRWDNWHLSTGPILHKDPHGPIMIYNGATEDARWRIGWIMFNKDCSKVLARCVQPLITPPPPEEREGTDIAFAASVVEYGELSHLYYSVDDRAVFRALIRRH